VSSIVPGPRKKLDEEIAAARSGAKPLDASALAPSAAPKQQLSGLDDWPGPLRAVVEADHDRVTALATHRRKTADLALPEVVRGLNELLDLITDRIEAGKPSLLRKSTAAGTDGLLEDVAELLGIPADDIGPAPGRSEHRAALRTIKQLRSQLKDLEASRDHSRLTRLATFIERLALAIDTAPEAAGLLAPTALDRFAQAAPDFQWDWTFEQKLRHWQESRKALVARSES